MRRDAVVTCLSEDTILCFVEGRLSTAALTAVESHVRSCSSCEQLLAAGLAEGSLGPSRAIPGAGTIRAEGGRIERGALVGRYTVLSFVGSGGMGEVYAAYDPQLDRRVALKLLRPESSQRVARAEARLLREARAIARLSHPNVIAVYDAGTFGDRVFVAMEYVDGETLASWLATPTRRSTTEILSVFRDAARGLAAAHAAGLIHRDFKPQNVMVARDGSARVADFGLVRRLEDSTGVAEHDGADARSGDPIDLGLTHPGELIGTPLYMSPEQFKMEPTDARTDQFSFCVALYRSLYGEHPFIEHEKAALGELRSHVLAGRVRPPSAHASVTPSIRRVLLRGLSADPAARWPSMTELAAALARHPSRSQRRTIGILASAALMAALLTGWRASRPAVVLCQSGPSRLADSWPPGSGSTGGRRRADALAASFVATKFPGADEISSRVSSLLDDYAHRWLAMYRDTCEATHVRGEQSAEVLDLRMACLEERRGSLKALTDALGNADRNIVEQAIHAAAALPDLDRCADIGGLRAVVPLPADRLVRERVDNIRRRAATAKALNDTGRHSQAIVETSGLVAEARAIAYEPLLAELLTQLGSFEVDAEMRPGTIATLEEATVTAIRARRDDLAAETAALLASAIGNYGGRPDEGERWAAIGEALVDRLGAGHERIRAWLLQSRAGLSEASDPEAALRFSEQAVALKRKVLPPDHPDVANALVMEAEELHRRGDDARALEVVVEAESVLMRAYGPRSAHVAQAMSNRGEYLLALGRPAEALPLFRDAAARWEAAMGPTFRFLAYPLTGMGRALLALRRPGDARGPLERAMQIRRHGEPRPIERADTSFALAQAVWAEGDRERALILARSARDEYAAVSSAKQQADDAAAWIAHHRS